MFPDSSNASSSSYTTPPKCSKKKQDRVVMAPKKLDWVTSPDENTHSLFSGCAHNLSYATTLQTQFQKLLDQCTNESTSK